MFRRKESGKQRKETSTSSAPNRVKEIRIPGLRILRLSLQVFFFILLNTGLTRFASLVFPIPIIPVLSSSAAPGVTAISAFDALQYGISTAFPLLLIVALGVFIISALLIGKAFCGYVCPFGFAEDLVAYLRVPLRMKDVTLQPKTLRSVSRLKYYILAIVLLVATVMGAATLVGQRQYATIAVGIFSDVPFAVLSPADTLFATITEMILLGKQWFIGWSLILWLRFVILVICLGAVIYIPRAFCRYICPVGALMGPMNKYSLIGLERNVVKCLGEKCKVCEKVCPMGVPIFTGPEKRFSKHSECILCLKCKDVCREKAIRFAVG